MYGDIGKGIVSLFRVMTWCLAVFIPLGLWKIFDIIMWLYRNISVNFGG